MSVRVHDVLARKRLFVQLDGVDIFHAPLESFGPDDIHERLSKAVS